MWVNLGVGCSPDRGCIELSKAPIVLRKSWLYRLHAAKPNGILLLNIGRNFFFFFFLLFYLPPGCKNHSSMKNDRVKKNIFFFTRKRIWSKRVRENILKEEERD